MSEDVDPTAQPMSARRQVRLAVMVALETIPGINTLESPGQWPTPEEKLPAILMRAPRSSKESKARAQPQFDTTVTVDIEARLKGKSQEDAQDQIEALEDAIENALLKSYWLVKIVQQVSSIESETEINVDGKPYLAGLKMSLSFECYEVFDPAADAPTASAWPPPAPVIVALQEIGIHADLINVFDAYGTYSDAEFPYLPAPRPYGPDGRDEAYVQLFNLDWLGPGGLDEDFMLDVSTLE